MGRTDGADGGARRRTVLKLLSAAAGAQLVPAVGADLAVDRTFAVEQGDRCIPVVPLAGDESVEELYDWREGDTHYSSAGTQDLQRQDTSILFLYAGPDGLSLVLVHGHYKNHDSDGGSVSMTFTGLPERGEWIVEDDNYDGTANYDNWNHDGTRSEIDWTWRYGRTDGGAFRGLEDDFEITIEPAFNEASHYQDEYYDGTVVDWQVVSGDRDDPDRTSLALDQPITIRAGSCDDVDDTDDGNDGADDDETSDDGDSTDDGETDDGDDQTETGDGGEEETEGEDGDGGDDGDDHDGVVVSSDTDANVETRESVLVRADVELDGNVEAGKRVDVNEGAAIDGNVEAGGDVTVDADGAIDGNVESDGTVAVGANGVIDGNVTAARIDVADSAEITGNAETDSDDDGEDSEDEAKRRTKHEKQQRKHEKKHEKRQRKHEKEAERERKKQRKHEKKSEKKGRKHRKKGGDREDDDSSVVEDAVQEATDAVDGDD